MDAAPGRNSLGAVNSLGQMMSSVTRTIAPSFASSLFSISLQKQWLGGYFVYFLLLVIVLIGSYVSHRLPGGMRDRSWNFILMIQKRTLHYIIPDKSKKIHGANVASFNTILSFDVLGFLPASGL